MSDPICADTLDRVDALDLADDGTATGDGGRCNASSNRSWTWLAEERLAPGKLDQHASVQGNNTSRDDLSIGRKIWKAMQKRRNGERSLSHAWGAVDWPANGGREVLNVCKFLDRIVGVSRSHAQALPQARSVTNEVPRRMLATPPQRKKLVMKRKPGKPKKQ